MIRMMKTKKEIDSHVRTSLSRLKTENERLLRGFTIAKLYYKVNEYALAEQFLSGYLSIMEEAPAAHKLLGQCYQHLKKNDKALAAYQRSLQLDSKQKDILIEVCKLLLEDNSINPNKAKYWCDLAESENVSDESIFSLRLKFAKQGDKESKTVEDIIRGEIAANPKDVKFRIRLVRHFIEKDKIMDAFKYAYNLELASQYEFSNSADWYTTLWLVLSKYEHSTNVHKDWDFWLLLIITLERQVYNSLLSNRDLPNGGITETSNLLFNFDQYLHKATRAVASVCHEKELAKRFLTHYMGQLCLHAASLMFKREIVQNKNQWKETTKNAAPLLLLAFQCGIVDSNEPWTKHCSEQTKKLIQFWNREGAFRCAQSGRTLLAFIDDNNGHNLSKEVKNLISTSSTWSSSEELIARLRQFCADNSWRNNIYGILFCNSDQRIKDQTSILVKSPKLNDIIFKLPSCAEIETYEEIAQYLSPQSLQHMVYLGLGTENLSDIRCDFFSGLSFSTQNLSFCGAESLNQLDVSTYLYGSIIHAKRLLQVERNIYENHNCNTAGKPLILPFSILQSNLCSEETVEWWNAAYQVYKNLVVHELSEIRSTLQHGIEAVRGINGPKIDLIIIFLIAKIIVNRLNDCVKPVEKSMLQTRAESLYKFGLNMFKLHNRGVLEPFRKIFKYAYSNNSQVERELNKLADDAVTFLATIYFKKFEYDECIEEFQGLHLPFATFYQSEAYRKLDESNKTPKKTKRVYLDKAKDCLNQTLNLLSSTNVDPDHPLKSKIHAELKQLQYANNTYNDSSFNNTSSYEDAELGSFLNTTPSYHQPANRSLRDVSRAPTHNSVEIEQLSKQMESTLVFLKDLKDMFQPEMNELKKEVISLRDKITSIEESMKKKPIQGSATDSASNILDDVYIIDDELQNQIYPNQNNMFSSYQNQNLSSSLSAAAHVAQGTPYQNPLFNPNHPMNFYPPHFMLPPPINGAPQAPRNSMGIPSYEPFNIQTVNHLTPLLTQQFDRTASTFYNLLNQGQYPNIALPQVSLPPSSLPLQQGLTLTAVSQPAGTITTPSILPPSIPPLLAATTMAPASNQQQPQYSNLSDKFSSNNSMSPVSNPLATINSFKKVINNTPVEKEPPVNVVITSSDPLPTNTGRAQTQPTLSVTIPPHHIKSGNISSDSPSFFSNLATQFPSVSTTSKFPTPSLTTNTNTTSVTSFGTIPQQTLNFSFKPTSLPVESSIENKSFESVENELHKNEPEYDPCPDFQPIIPLPDKVVVVTGEEGEEILFSSRAKLFRHADKEWKERGIGEIKILRNKDQKYRIIMRREQTHKICANHQITSETVLTTPPNNELRGYIWVANDFADESIKLEKFFVRFKMAETAQEFYNVFTKAKEELKKMDNINESIQSVIEKSSSKPATKTIVFSSSKTSTPADKNDKERETISSKQILSKPSKSLFEVDSFDFTKNNKVAQTTPTTATTATAKPTVFANFSFDTKKEPPKPLSDIFGSLANNTKPLEFKFNPLPSTTTTTTIFKEDNINKSVSDTEEEYIPTAQFKPVIALPDLVELKTGEENELVLFEHRAKLLRFDKETNEWKERGLGQIKLLQNKYDVNELRLVMRREIIHKLCCNQRLLKDTVFKYPKNMKCALMWAGKDFSDNELQTETFSIRFKTLEICEMFFNAIQKAQSNMSANSAISETDHKENTAAKIFGFGDKFKPKAGSWNCIDCYTSNDGKDLYCAACESPKDKTMPRKEAKSIIDLKMPTTKFTFGIQPTSSTISKTTNDSTPPSVTIAKSSAANVTTKPTIAQSATKGFGDAFKAKVDSWQCDGCYISNSSDSQYCIACDTPKEGTTQQKQLENLADAKSKNSFSYGFSSNTSDPKNSSLSFGTPKDVIAPVKDAKINLATTNTPTSVYTFGYQNAIVTPSKTTVAFNFGAPKEELVQESIGKALSTGFSFASKINETIKLGNRSISPPVFAYRLTSKTVDGEKNEFKFTLKSRSPTKTSSTGFDEENHEDTSLVEEEENNTYFTPVIPLPDKIDVKTGEEDEEVLYCHRAKLFRLVNREWKERGLGDVKILRHNNTKKLRVLMRREHVFKICLNHLLSSDINYDRKDERSWIFVVNSVNTNDDIELQTLVLRFKSKEVSEQFMDTIKQALANEDKTEKNVPQVEVLKISDENKALADRLKLPYSFFEKSYDECSGCRGCNPDKFNFPQYENPNKDIVDDNPIPLNLPNNIISKSNNSIIKQSALLLKSPLIKETNDDKPSFTGANIFSGARTDPSTFSFSKMLNTTQSNDIKTSSSFGSGFSNNIFSGTQDKSKSLFDGKSIFGGGNAAASENKTLNLSSNQSTPSLFSTSNNTSAFDLNQPLNSGDNAEKSSSFGSIFNVPKPIDNNAKENETVANKPKPSFSNTTSNENEKPNIFGGNSLLSKPVFGSSSGFLFSSNATPNSILGMTPDESKEKELKALGDGGGDNLFKSSSGIDFATLATQSDGTSSFKTAENTSGFVGLTNNDAFKSFMKTKTDDNQNASANSPGQNCNEDESYDPHYDPIIALPDQITVSTGEEEEEKQFNERAKLFRYDATNKEWKERGVGELKVLYHPTRGTYRLLMRREQIFKLVLNFAITPDFSMKHLNNCPKSFCWAGMNHAEEPEKESLAVRFKNAVIAKQFEDVINSLSVIKNRATDIDPKDD